MSNPLAARGVNHGNSKLDEAKVRDIITSTASVSEVAKRYDIDPGHVRAIRRGKAWTHVWRHIYGREP